MRATNTVTKWLKYFKFPILFNYHIIKAATWTVGTTGALLRTFFSNNLSGAQAYKKKKKIKN